MTRKLSETEIENMLDFIQPQEGIPLDTAMSVVQASKERLRQQLRTQHVYPEIIPVLKAELVKNYKDSLVQPGESVGVICAQSIGEKQTQTTLNSVDWVEMLLYSKNGFAVVEPIGQMIDRILEQDSKNITYIEENRTEYLPLLDGYMIPSTDEDGNMDWYKIEAVTRHLPVGKLVKVVTQSGRSVTATQSKSFLVWNGTEFTATPGSEVKVGDVMPTTKNLVRHESDHKYFYMESIFPKSKYLYTTEVVKAREYRKMEKYWWENHAQIDFIVPYVNPRTFFGKSKDFMLTCEPGYVFLHESTKHVSKFPDKILLDNNFGFFLGIYLAEGVCTKRFISISNKSPEIRDRIASYCSQFGVTYYTVETKSRLGTGCDMFLNSQLLTDMVRTLCKTGSASKQIPNFVYTAPMEFIVGLIDGYFSGDGHVTKKDGSISVSSASEELITGISFLLTYLGIFSLKSSYQPSGGNTGCKDCKREFRLSIRNTSAQQFARKISLTNTEKQNRLMDITLAKVYLCPFDKKQTGFPERDVYFDEVVSVEMVDGTTEYVYDLTVETTRNFQLWNGLNLRDTFHRAGQSEITMTAGVPRFKELVDATKKPKIVNHKIYLNGGNSTVQETRATVGHSIAGLTMANISESITIEMDKEDEAWYEAHKILFGDEFGNHSHCVSFKLNMKKLYEFKLSMQQIADYIHEEFSDLYCVFSPPAEGQLDVFVDTGNIILPEDRLLFVDQENAPMIYMEEVVQTALEKMYICGIPAITEVFYMQEGKEWIVETNGFDSKTISKQYSSYKRLLTHPDVDYTRTISSNVWDIYEVLDIEAARQFLIEEFMTIMEGINTCHTMLLVDRMTHGGTISSITRYTLKGDESGPMGKASFEETMDNFLNAAAQGQYEPTRGVSASIICGKRATVGTGMIKLGIDIPRLPPFKKEVGDVRKLARERAVKRSRSRKRSSQKKLLTVPETQDEDVEDVEGDEIPLFTEI
jgi:DNA-directed RNA polymerase beta' subunit